MAMGFNFKEHYEKNKDEINAKRRRKYHDDPEYYKRVRSNAKESYNRTIKRMQPIDRQTIVDGTGEKYWSIGRVSRLIGRTIITIRRHHVDGVIPLPIYYDSRGWRLYSTRQVSLLRKVFHKLDDEKDLTVQSLSDVSKFLATCWEDKDGEDEGKTKDDRSSRRSRNR
jgi:hypothetical protein